ncbi:hypothetical protein CEE60_02805 [Stenotrophomonas maltophilia]|uniref:Uncharacterized protein n=1 Tax=Stenotrophomonas maltophilia TaxID=40324 RepID=A0A246HR29_STEMA|nr:hypothetical protein CEE60_02805 [Stenotrophomonas maltophilia]
MSFLPSGSQALRHFADLMDGQAARCDVLQRRPRGERSTTADAYRLSASLARQQATKLERLEQQLAARAGGES